MTETAPGDAPVNRRPVARAPAVQEHLQYRSLVKQLPRRPLVLRRSSEIDDD